MNVPRKAEDGDGADTPQDAGMAQAQNRHEFPFNIEPML